MRAYDGACHCGAITARFETDKAPDQIQVRACQCGFCRRHGAKTVGDPEGRLILSFSEAATHRYRFGSGSMDVLICRNCGDYVAAVMENVAVLNVVAADIRSLADRTADPMDYDGETPAAKRARHLERWTPVTLEVRP